MNKLMPYGSEAHAGNVAKVGKLKSPRSLVERMPSAEVAAKVGPGGEVPVQPGLVAIVRLNAQR